jgi:hypothetical protein
MSSLVCSGHVIGPSDWNENGLIHRLIRQFVMILHHMVLIKRDSYFLSLYRLGEVVWFVSYLPRGDEAQVGHWVLLWSARGEEPVFFDPFQLHLVQIVDCRPSWLAHSRRHPSVCCLRMSRLRSASAWHSTMYLVLCIVYRFYRLVRFSPSRHQCLLTSLGGLAASLMYGRWERDRQKWAVWRASHLQTTYEFIIRICKLYQRLSDLLTFALQAQNHCIYRTAALFATFSDCSVNVSKSDKYWRSDGQNTKNDTLANSTSKTSTQHNSKCIHHSISQPIDPSRELHSSVN